MIGIYRITCLDNLKSYFGSTKDHKRRIGHHKAELKRNKHRNAILQNSWNKYGEDAFTFEFIEEVEEKDLLIREQCYLDMMFDGKKYLGFNIARSALGGNATGRKTTEETKRLMSIAHTGKKMSEYAKSRMRIAKQNISGETRKKMSIARTGMKDSEKTKAIKSLANIGKHDAGITGLHGIYWEKRSNSWVAVFTKEGKRTSKYSKHMIIAHRWLKEMTQNQDLGGLNGSI